MYLTICLTASGSSQASCGSSLSGSAAWSTISPVLPSWPESVITAYLGDGAAYFEGIDVKRFGEIVGANGENYLVNFQLEMTTYNGGISELARVKEAVASLALPKHSCRAIWHTLRDAAGYHYLRTRCWKTCCLCPDKIKECDEGVV